MAKKEINPMKKLDKIRDKIKKEIGDTHKFILIVLDEDNNQIATRTNITSKIQSTGLLEATKLVSWRTKPNNG